ncbi:MAG: glycosyltransferase family 4 protein [Xanthobacteraceae bacterium]
MRILHAVLSEGFYGSERYCAELASQQARHGHDVDVLIQGSWTDCARQMRKSVALANTVGAGTMKLTVIPSWAPSALHRPLARRALRHFKPDVVHTHLNPAARRVGREAQSYDIPHVATLHLTYAKRELGDCDGIICIAPWQLDTITGFTGEIAVIENWVPKVVIDNISETTDEQIAKLRRSWGAGDETFVLGTVGRLVPEKGIDRLVRIFRTVFSRWYDSVRLVIVGDGPQRDEIRQLAADDPRIILAGAQENVAPFYSAFDTYVSPARFEPFGLAILEAMAAGCPLVLTRTEGPSEYIRDDRVLWAGPKNETLLAARMVESVALGRRRFTYELKPFSQERAAEQIEAFYRRAMKRRGK